MRPDEDGTPLPNPNAPKWYYRRWSSPREAPGPEARAYFTPSELNLMPGHSRSRRDASERRSDAAHRRGVSPNVDGEAAASYISR